MPPSLDTNFIPNREASETSGYHQDYLARLCREGKVEGVQVGRAWHINRHSLLKFIREQEVRKHELAEQLSRARKETLAQSAAVVAVPEASVEAPAPVAPAIPSPYAPTPSGIWFYRGATGVAVLLLILTNLHPISTQFALDGALNREAARLGGAFGFGHDIALVPGTSTAIASPRAMAYGNTSQAIYQQFYVNGASTEYVNAYVAAYVSSALKDIVAKVGAQVLDGRGVSHATSGSTNSVAVDLTNISGSTITNSTFSGSVNATTVNVATLTVSGTATFATTSTSGPATFTGTTTISGPLVIGGLNGVTECLHVDANGVVSGTGIDCGSGGGGLTGLKGQYSSLQTGAIQTFATSSDTNIGLTITSAGDVHTFTPTWIGTLGVNRGGTGLATPPTYGQLLLGNGGGGYALAATSTLGISSSDITEGSKLFYTDGRVATYLNTVAKEYFFATTSADFWQSQRDLFSTSSAAYFLAQNQGNAFSSTSASYFLTQNQGAAFSTTSANHWLTTKSTSNLAEGSNLYFTDARVQTYLDTISKGYFYSTTSSDHWLTTKTTDNLAQGSTNKYYNDSLVNTFVGASSTIAKTFTTNVFTALNSFTGGLAIGALNGPLQVNNGVVSATTTIGVLYGGTGSTTLTGLLKGNGTSQVLTAVAGTDYQAPITLTTTGTSGAATFIGNTLNIPQYSGTTYTGTYPVQVSGSVISLAFGTSTSNTWGGTQTFTNTPVLGTLSGLVGANNGALYQVATTTLYGTGAGGQVLTWNNGAPQWVATTTYSAGSGISTSFAAGNLTISNTGVLAIGPTGQTQTGTVTVASSTAGTDFTVTASAGTITFNLPTASASNRGLLSSTDWTTFTNKQAALTFTYPLVNSANTVSLAFGTTTTNAWSSLQTFNGGFIAQGSTTIAGDLTVSGNATTTNATTTNLYVSTSIRGGGLTSCSLSSDKLLYNSTTGQFSCGADAGAGGGITALKGQYSSAQTGSTQTFATSSDTNLGLTITSAGDTHTFTPVWIGTLAVNRGGTGQSSFTSGQLIYGNGTNALTSVGTTSETLSAEFAFSGTLGALVGGTSGTLSLATNGVAYSKLAQAAANTILGNPTGATGNIVAFATSSLGIALADTTGTLTVARGGTGTTTAPAGQIIYGGGAGVYQSAATGTVAAGSGVSVTAGQSVIGAGLTITNTGVLAVGPVGQTTSGTALFATSTAGTDFTITGAGSTITFNLPTASGSARGLLSSSDWTTFNNKQAALTFTYPLVNTGNTVSIAFGTTTSNTWAGTQTFTNAPVLGSLSGVLYGNNGTLATAATSSIAVSGAFNYSGTLGTFVGGTNGTLSLATNGVALTNLAQIAANSVLVNNTSATGNVTAIATSTFFGLGNGGQVLTWNNGAPQWVATTTYAAGTGISTSFAAGQLTITNTGITSLQQTGGGSAQTGAITFATSSVTNNGVTIGLNVTNVGGAFTFTPTRSGTLTAAGGGTGFASYTPGDILYADTATTFARAASSTDGFVLALANGKPTWVATTTLSSITGTLGVTKGGTGLTSIASSSLLIGGPGNTFIGYATSSLGIALSDTTGTLTIVRGGTGTTTAPVGQLIYGGATSYQSVATGTVASGSGISVTAGQAIIGSGLTITNTGLLSLQQLGGGSAQTGAVTFATSSQTTNGQTIGLNITNTAGAFTFAPTIGGTLTVAGGGTGQTSFTAGQILYGNGTNGLTSVGTTSETLSSEFSYSGTLGALVGGSSGTLSLATNGVALNKLVQVGANTILGNNTGATGNVVAFATSTLFGTGTNGFVLAVVNGIPTWTATSSINNGVSSIQQTGGGSAQTGAITFATSSVTNNGVTIGLNITNTGSAFTFAPTRSGTLTVAGGGTGVGSFTAGQLIYGNGTNNLTSVATTTIAVSGAFNYSGTLGALVGGTGGTLSLATNGVALTNIAQIAANSILANGTGATGNVTALATSSLGIALSDTTGTLSANRGGTGFASYTPGDILYADTAASLARVASSTDGFILGLANGKPTWVATTTLSSITGTLVIAKGGTGTTTAPSGQILYGGGAGVYQSAATGTVAAGTGVSVTAGQSIIGSGLTITNTGVLAVGPAGQTTNGTALFATSTAGTDFTITGSGATITFNLPTASGSARGLLSSSDWTTFNNKQAALTFTYPLVNTGNTVSIAFGTTTSNTWAGTQTFTNAPVLGSLSGVIYGNNGTLATAATSSIAVSGAFSYSGTLGTFVGGSNGTLSLATNGVALTNLAQIGANTVLVNNTSATGNVTTIATSTFFGLGNGGQVLTWNNGVPQWVATTTYAAGTGISTSFAAGQLTITNTGITSLQQTGGGSAQTGAITFATSSVTNNGVTIGLNVTNVGGAFTFTPTRSGTLTAAGGGTGFASYTPGDILYADTATTFARAASSTDGFVLALANGKPTWVATTTLSTISGTLGVTKGGTGLTSIASSSLLIGGPGNTFIGYATSSLGIALADTTGTLTIARGGTGTTTAPVGQLIYGGATSYQSVATGTVASGSGISVTAGQAIIGSGLTITNTGLLSLQQLGGGSAQTGAITFATSSQTTNGQTIGLNITNTSGAFTFAPTIGGTLTVAGGGTGQTSFTAGQILYGNGTNGLTSVGTTSETLSSEFAYSGTLGALVGGSSGTLSLATNGVALNKLVQVGANTILGNNTGATGNVVAFATSTLFGAGTNGFVLAVVNGVPTWTATSSINNGVSSIQQTGGGSAQTGAITFATSSVTNNGVTIGLNITNTGSAFTFAPTRSGTLTVAGGGTGVGSFTAGQLIYGNGTNNLSSVATTTIAVSGAFNYSGTLGALVGGTGGTLSLATNGVALTNIAQIAANSILANGTGATGNVTALATSSLGIALSDTTGTLLAARGGTGFASYTPGDILYADTAASLARVASSTDGFILGLANGKPTWVATTTLSSITGTLAIAKGGTGTTTAPSGQILYGGGAGVYQSAATGTVASGAGISVTGNQYIIGSGLTITNTGVTSIQQSSGSAQTGAITLATSSAVSFNGLTFTNSITNSSGTFTFTPALSGTLTVAGGGTGVSSFTAGQLVYGNGTNNLTSVATSSQTLSAEFSDTGTFGALVGGTSGTLSLATNGVAYSKLAQAAANTILGNPTGATGNLQAFATSSLGIALADTTGTLSVARGGTGSTTLSGILRGNGTGQVSTLIVGSGLTFDGTTLATSGSGITSIGAAGQLQSGGTQTFATSTGSFNGLTLGMTVVSSANTHTFTPSITGTLGVAGGGTGAASFTAGALVYGAGTGALQTVGTSTETLSSEFSYSGTLGALVGGSSGTLSLATNGVALNKLVQVGANTILGNNTGATGNVVAFATSTLFGTGVGGQVLTWSNGVPRFVATTTFSAPLAFANGNVTITQAGTGADGYLSSTDFATFNNKVSSTSLSATYPLAYNSATGVFTTAFGTTTSNTWAGTQTFTNTIKVGSLTGFIAGNAGTLYQIASSSLNLPTSALASQNVSQFTNDAGYLTPTWTTTIDAANNTLNNVNMLTFYNGATRLLNVTDVYNKQGLRIADGFSPTNRADLFPYYRDGGAAFQAGDILVASSSGAYYAAATSTLGFESALTFSSPLTRTGNTVGIQVANGSQNGYLSSSDWTTFSSKLSAYDAWSHPSAGVSATTSGLIITASSTIGNGSPAGGLTIAGNSTTTGIAIASAFAGNGTNNSLLTQNGIEVAVIDTSATTIALGLYNNSSSGANSSAVGLNNNASGGSYNSAFGFGNTSSGYLSSAFGSQNVASNNTSGAFGASNNVSGVQAYAFGYAITNAIDNTVMIGPSDAAKVTIRNTGKVGIGTTTPTAQLEVENDTNALALLLTVRNNYGTTGSAGSRIGFGVHRDIDPTALGASIDAINKAGVNNGDIAQGADLVFNTSPDATLGLAERLRITNVGDVGVGTNTPSARLSVQGNGLFSGNLAAAGLTATGTVAFTNLSSGLVGSNNGTLYSLATSTSFVTSVVAGTGINVSGATGAVTISNSGLLSLQQLGGGSAQTGAITFATSSVTNNGVTIGLNITNSAGAFTFTPTRSGTLTVAGGGTGAASFTAGQILYGNGTNALSSVGTTTETLSSEFAYSGTLGALVGGSSGTLSLATNGVALNKLVQVGANTILGNNTGATGNVVAFATSTLFGTGVGGQVLAIVNGVPNWVATSSINNGVSSIQQLGGGSAQTGAITFATSSVTNNGVTIGLNITNSGGAFTFTPTRSGTLTVAGGGTGFASYTPGDILYADTATSFAKVSSTTDGFVLALANGKPTWVASTTLSTITGTLGVTKGGTGLTSIASSSLLIGGPGNTFIGYATSSLGIALTDTTGTLSIARGGTGTTTAPAGQILYGGGAGVYQSVATGTVAGGTNISVTAGQSVIGSGLTIGITGQIGVGNGGTGVGSFTAGQILYGNGTNALTSVATTSIAVSGAFNYSGTLGALVGGTGGTLSLATNGVALTNIAQIAANSILANGTGATGNVTALATSSLGIALTDTTGTLAVNRGGTGFASYTPGDLLYANSGTTFAKVSSSTDGFVLGLANGKPTWVATSTLATISGSLNLGSQVTGTLGVTNGGTGSTTLSGILRGNGTGQVSTLIVGSGLTFDGTTLATSGSGITSIGAAGQLQSGGTQTFATSTGSFNGLTLGMTIVSNSNTHTFTPSISGTLGVAGGGTGVGTFTGGQLIYGNGTNALTSVATSSLAVSGAFSYSGTLGALVGGAGGTLSLATNGVALTNLAQIAANTILANPTGATGNVQAVATSTLYGTGAGGQVLTWNNGAPQWVATTTYSGGSGISTSFAAGNLTITNTGLLSLQQLGGGSAQTGAITFATSSQTTNGQTIGLNITNTGGAFTFSPTISGVQTVAGGGTGVGSFTAGQLIYGNGTNNLTSVGTTTETLSSEFSYSGTLGALVGGSSGTLSLATNGVALNKLVQVGANTILGNNTGATGNVVAFATSTLFGTGTGGQVLAISNGVPTWIASTTYANGSGISTSFAAGQLTITNTGVTAVGPTGQSITGGVVVASSTSTTNGITSAITVVGSGQNLTFTPSQSGTLTVGGGGTGQTSLASGQLIYGAGTAGVQSVATSSLAVSGAFSYSGTLGALVGGAGGTLSLATNGVALTNIAQIAANSVLVNNTSATGNVTAIATSTFFGVGTGGQVLAIVNGVPNWVATSSINNGVSSIQQLGGGSAQTGAITFATSSATLNGQTHGLNITNSGAAFTFTPTLSGTLTVGGGGTGFASYTPGDILYADTATSFAKVSSTTDGFVLALANGKPTWVASTTLSTITGTLGVTKGGTGLTSIASSSLLIGGPGNTILGYATSSLGIALSDTTGTLGATRGGTGLTTIASSSILIGGAGNTWLQYATSSLGINLSDTVGTLTVGRGGTGVGSFTAGQLIYGNGSNNLTSVATSSIAVSGAFSYSGTLGALVGGANGTLSLATNGVALTNIAQIAANTLLANPTGATGNVQAIATSTLFGAGTNGFVLALSGGVPTWVATTTLSTISGQLNLGNQVTSTLGVTNGGTGSTTLSGILRGNGTGQVSTLIVGSGLTFDGTTLSSSGSGITAIGPTGQTQSGATITIASSTGSFNGLTIGTTIVGAGNTLTFTPSLSGTLTVAGGGTGVGSFTAGQLIYGNGTNNLTSVSTSSLAVSGAFSYSGTLGALVGGANGTLSLATNGVALTNLAQIGANSVLVNNTSATGNVTAIATSTFFGAGTGGQVLTWNNGVPQWVATTTYANGSGISTAFAAGQLTITNTGLLSLQQTGGGSAQTGAITFATSSATSNGVTIGLNITNSSGAFTFTPTRSGTLTVGGGGTGVGSFTAGQLIYGNGTNNLSSVGTTTPTIGLGLTGTNLVTLTSALGASSLSIATSSLYTGTQGQVAYFTGTNALAGTSTLFIDTNGRVGVGTSTPYGLLSINPNGIGSVPAFVIGSSSASLFTVSNAGNVALYGGTPSPTTGLVIGSGTSNLSIGVDSSIAGTGSNNIAVSGISGGAGTNNFGLYGGAVNGTNNYGVYVANGLPGVGATNYAFYAASVAQNYFRGLSGFGSTSPFARISIHAMNGDTATTLFAIGSSTASATTTLFSISNTGSTTAANGFNILAGCYAINNTCLAAGVGSNYFTNSGANTYLSTGSKLGIGTTTPWAQLAVNPDALGSGVPSFVIGSSTGTQFVVASNGKVGVGTSTPTAGFTVVFNGTDEKSPTFLVATTSEDGVGQDPILLAYATTTGDLNYARVGIGTTSPWGNAGLRDQLTVDGRIYSTWRYTACDYFGGGLINATLIVADTKDICAPFAFDQGGTTGSIGIQSTAGAYPPYVILRAAASATGAVGTSNAGATLSLPTPTGAASSSPTVEAWVRPSRVATATTTPLYIVGMTNHLFATALGASAALPTNGIYFAASSTQNWMAVIRRAGTDRAYIDTGISTSTTNFQKMRIEVSSSTAIFLMNGTVVAQSGVANGVTLPAATLKPIILVQNVTGSTGGSGDFGPRLDVSLLRYWLDDPATPMDGGPPPDAGPSPDIPYDRIAGAEIAESYLASPATSFISGMIVVGESATSSQDDVRMSEKRYDVPIMGVVSTAPREVLGEETEHTIRVAQVGRVPVIVSLENGPIAKGDTITTSSVPGVGMRANRVGSSVGRALDRFDPEHGFGQCDESVKNELAAVGIAVSDSTCVARIIMTIDTGYAFSVANFFQDAEESLSDIAAAVTELSADVFDKGVAYTKLVIQQVVAKIAVVENLYAAAITLLPGGDLTLPSGPDQVTGTATLVHDTTSIYVANSKVKDGSKIFLTPHGLLESPLAVTQITPGEGFTVSTLHAPSEDIIFDWLMITTYATGTPQAPAPDPVPPTAEPPQAAPPVPDTVVLPPPDTAEPQSPSAEPPPTTTPVTTVTPAPEPVPEETPPSVPDPAPSESSPPPAPPSDAGP